MDGLIHAFGIDWKLILIQIVNFVVLAGLLGYFLYTPVLRMLEKRQNMVAKGVRKAEEAEEMAVHAERDRDEKIARAEGEARDVVARAKQYAEEQSTAALQAATEKAASVEAEGVRTREAIIGDAYKEADAEITKVAVLAAEKVLREREEKIHA